MDFNKNLSYTNRDFNKIREDIIRNVNSITTKWTDFNESDLGMVFIEALAGVSDMLNFYLDNQSLETYISTAKQEKNIRAILSTIGYKIPLWTSSMCTQKIVLNEAHDFDIEIPSYFEFTSDEDDSIIYCTNRTHIIPKGTLEIDIPVLEGYRRDYIITTDDIKKSYKIMLPNERIAEGSIILNINGEIWTEVEDVFLVKEGGRYFSVHEDRDKNIYILLSWDYTTYLSLDNTFKNYITYRVTKGIDGSVSNFKINKTRDILYDVEGNSMSNKFITYNIDNSTGGSSGIPLDLMKSNAISRVKTMGRLVTLKDYKSYLECYPGVCKSQVLDWSISESYVEKPYVVDVYIVPNEGIELSDSFKDKIYKDIKEKNVVTTEVRIKTPNYVDLNLDIKVLVNSNVNQLDIIRKNIISSLKDKFNISNCKFGQTIWIDEIRTHILKLSDYIVNIIIDSPTKDIILKKNEFIRLNSLDIEVSIDG